MRIHVLERAQVLPYPVEQVFAFFADAGNLELITPTWLHFRLLTPLPIVMSKGTRIEYRIRWRWVPWPWVTEICEWQPPFSFIDQQLRGPYRLWHHTHRFDAVAEGTRMTDVVRYALPYGPIGNAAHRLLVRHDLERIFAYRRACVGKVFESE